MAFKKNYCSACGFNFLTESLYMAHRVGPYTHRRCLTDVEMYAKGWGCRELPVADSLNGSQIAVLRHTWVLPGQVERREELVVRMREISRTG